MLRKQDLSDSKLYYKDFYTWAIKQFDALTELRQVTVEAGLNCNVDWDNLLEEVEDLAGRQLDSVGGFMVNIVTHLLAIEYLSKSTACQHWQQEIQDWRLQMRSVFEDKPGTTSAVSDTFVVSKWNLGVRRFITKVDPIKKERIRLERELIGTLRWPLEEICGFDPQSREQDMPEAIEPSLPDGLVDVLEARNVEWNYKVRFSQRLAG